MHDEIKCLRCETKMDYLMTEKFQLGQTSRIFGTIPNVVAGSLALSVYCCPQCRKVEFFAARDEHTGSVSPLPQIKCPNCGKLHDFDYPKCPVCRYDHTRNRK